MRRKVAALCMVLGAALLIAALSLFFWNRWDDGRAGESAAEILSELKEQIGGGTDIDPYETGMTEVEIGDYTYVGYIYIPVLDLELPVMSDWSYEQLALSPCRYYGSTKTDDLVIAAHNYSEHFGSIKNLIPGDEVYYTDMDGVVNAYEVVELDTLNPTAIEEMTSSGYDLTLFTCTYGGQSRVTVRCDRI